MKVNALWVEEEPASLRYELGRVKQLGWNVTPCSNVAEALMLLKSQAFDVVILDLILPKDESTQKKGMVEIDAGIGLLKKIRDPLRQGQTSSNVPILVVSAIGSREQREEVVKMLTAERYFIRKPINENVFMRIIHELDNQLNK